MKILLRGGLGNQLFQILMGIESERRFGVESSYSNIMLRRRMLNGNELIWSNYSEELGLPQHKHSGMGGPSIRLLASSFLLGSEGPTYAGEFVSSLHAVELTSSLAERWVDAPGSARTPAHEDVNRLRSLVQTRFMPPSLIPEEFFAIHIRLGDYKNLSETYGSLNSHYWPSVAQELQKSRHFLSPIVLFSDSPTEALDLARIWFRGQIILASDLCVDLGEEFALMSRANGIAISNSTLSWWAARLGSPELVMRPSPFRGPALRLPQYRLPDDWKSVSA